MLLFNILGKSLTELTNKGALPSHLPSSKSASLITNIPSQKSLDEQQHAPSTQLITSTSISSNSGTTVVTNGLLATKKVVQTKTISPPVLIQVKQEPASSSCMNPQFTKPLNTQLVAIKSEPLAGQEHRQQNRNNAERCENTSHVNNNGNILKKDGKYFDRISF